MAFAARQGGHRFGQKTPGSRPRAGPGGLIKELGDVAWYLAETATALDVELEEVLLQNIEKLKRRYPEGLRPSALSNTAKHEKWLRD